MHLSFTLTENNRKELSEVFKTLSNPSHLQILLSLKTPKTTNQTHGASNYRKRESTYKALEKLVKANLIKKEYDQKTKKILYSLFPNP